MEPNMIDFVLSKLAQYPAAAGYFLGFVMGGSLGLLLASPRKPTSRVIVKPPRKPLEDLPTGAKEPKPTDFDSRLLDRRRAERRGTLRDRRASPGPLSPGHRSGESRSYRS